MLLPARNNQFEFFFSKTFIPQEIEERYMPYLMRIPGGMFARCIDFVNYGIQGFNLQNTQFDVVEQYDRKTPYSRIYRSPFSPEKLTSKEFTVTNQLYDGYVNYFLMLDLFHHYYSSAGDKFIPGIPFLRVMDGNGYEIFTIEFKNVLFTSIDGLDFNFSSNTIDMKTFSCTFRAQEVEIKLAI